MKTRPLLPPPPHGHAPFTPGLGTDSLPDDEALFNPLFSEPIKTALLCRARWINRRRLGFFVVLDVSDVEAPPPVIRLYIYISLNVVYSSRISNVRTFTNSALLIPMYQH